MDIYKEMYLKLFNAVTDSIKEIEKHNYMRAKFLLEVAQAECEEIYIEDETQ